MASITDSFDGYLGNLFRGRLNYSEGTVDNANNRSYVYLSLDIYSTDSSTYFYGYNNNGNIYLNGVNKASGNYTGTVDTTARRICQWEGWVTHNSDGAKSITITFTIDSGWCGHAEKSTTFTLTTIPRYASINNIYLTPSDVAITVRTVTSATCDLLEINLDGAGFTTVHSGNFTDKTVTIGGNLTSGFNHTIAIRVRRDDSQLKTTSATYYAPTNRQDNFIGLL